MTSISKKEAQTPLILRCHRLMEAFAKSNEERDFYLDRQEGFILYADLDKMQEDLDGLERELKHNPDRYCQIPKLTFYETKKIMEGFVNEKVYDIDTKEKLLDIIQSKEAREHFLEFIFDHHLEQEKWQQYYQERSRIRIIEWLRNNHFHFVFEEDLDLPKGLVEKLKQSLFDSKAGKDVLNARKNLFLKAKTYYSNEALNPRPKRGRPPKQVLKLEIEPQITTDVYMTVPAPLRTFLFTPDISNASAVTFSSKFESESELLSHKKSITGEKGINVEEFNQKLASLRSLSNRWLHPDAAEEQALKAVKKKPVFDSFDDDDDEDEEADFDFDEDETPKAKSKKTKVKETKQKAVAPAKKAPATVNKAPVKKAVATAKSKVVAPVKSKVAPKAAPKTAPKKAIPKPAPKKPVAKPASAKPKSKIAPSAKKPVKRK